MSDYHVYRADNRIKTASLCFLTLRLSLKHSQDTCTKLTARKKARGMSFVNSPVP